jgi:hypothetical protein
MSLFALVQLAAVVLFAFSWVGLEGIWTSGRSVVESSIQRNSPDAPVVFRAWATRNVTTTRYWIIGIASGIFVVATVGAMLSRRPGRSIGARKGEQSSVWNQAINTDT